MYKETYPLKRPVGRVSGWSTLRLPGVWLSIAVFFVYTGLEVAAGTWVYSLLTEMRGVPAMTAGAWVSVYWGSLTVGRLASGVVLGWVPVHQLLRLCIVGMALGAALIWLHLSSLVSFLGLAVMGLAAAPIFPSLIATTPERLGDAHAANSIGFQIAAAVLGQALLPGMIGICARSLGLEVVSPVLLTSALVLLGLYETLMTTRRHAGQELPRLV
jgi:fucose permease